MLCSLFPVIEYQFPSISSVLYQPIPKLEHVLFIGTLIICPSTSPFLSTKEYKNTENKFDWWTACLYNFSLLVKNLSELSGLTNGIVVHLLLYRLWVKCRYKCWSITGTLSRDWLIGWLFYSICASSFVYIIHRKVA